MAAPGIVRSLINVPTTDVTATAAQVHVFGDITFRDF